MAKLFYGNGECSIEGSGVRGVEIDYTGTVRAWKNCGEGAELMAGNNKIVIFSSSRKDLGPLFKYTGELKITSVLVADTNGEKMATTIKRVMDYSELLDTNAEDLTVTSERISSTHRHGNKLRRTSIHNSLIKNQYSDGELYQIEDITKHLPNFDPTHGGTIGDDRDPDDWYYSEHTHTTYEAEVYGIPHRHEIGGEGGGLTPEGTGPHEHEGANPAHSHGLTGIAPTPTSEALMAAAHRHMDYPPGVAEQHLGYDPPGEHGHQFSWPDNPNPNAPGVHGPTHRFEFLLDWPFDEWWNMEFYPFNFPYAFPPEGLYHIHGIPPNTHHHSAGPQPPGGKDKPPSIRSGVSTPPILGRARAPLGKCVPISDNPKCVADDMTKFLNQLSGVQDCVDIAQNTPDGLDFMTQMICSQCPGCQWIPHAPTDGRNGRDPGDPWGSGRHMHPPMTYNGTIPTDHNFLGGGPYETDLPAQNIPYHEHQVLYDDPVHRHDGGEDGSHGHVTSIYPEDPFWQFLFFSHYHIAGDSQIGEYGEHEHLTNGQPDPASLEGSSHKHYIDPMMTMIAPLNQWWEIYPNPENLPNPWELWHTHDVHYASHDHIRLGRPPGSKEKPPSPRSGVDGDGFSGPLVPYTGDYHIRPDGQAMTGASPSAHAKGLYTKRNKDGLFIETRYK